MATDTLLKDDLLDLDLKGLNDRDTIHCARLAAIRIFHLLRYILGPYHPNFLTSAKSTSILFDNKLIEKSIHPQNSETKHWRKISNYRKTISDEYLFWGTYFRKWPGSAYWEREDGTLPYAEYTTGVKIDGSRMDKKQKGMNAGTIYSIRDFILRDIDKIYNNLSLIDYIKSHVRLLSFSLERCSRVLRSSQYRIKTKSGPRTLIIALETIKEIEPVYIIPQLFSIQKTCDSLTSYFFKHKLKEGGWKHDHDSHGISNPLNTAEVSVPLYNSLLNNQLDKLEDSKTFLLESCHEDGYWKTTRSKPLEESPFANAFATNYLIKACGLNEPLVIKAIDRINDYLQNFDQFDEIHYFTCYCQSLRTVTNAVLLDSRYLGIKNELPGYKDLILKTLKRYWDKSDNSSDDFKISVFAASMGLLAVSFIDKALGENSFKIRYDLSQNILSHPEIPFPNKVMWYHSKRAKEFTHWVIPWSIVALTKQPFIDNFKLLDMSRQIMSHYRDSKGVRYDKKGRYHIWAAGHLLYSLQNVLEFFSKKSLYSDYFKNGRFCLNIN